MDLRKYLLHALQDYKLHINSLPNYIEYWNKFVGKLNFFIMSMEEKYSALTNENNKLTADLETIEQIAHLGFWYLSLKTKHLFLSKEIYSLLGVDYVKGVQNKRELLRLVHPEDKYNYIKLMNTSLAEMKKYETKIRILHSNETYKWFFVTGEPVSPHVFRGIFMDVTEQMETDCKLHISNENLLKSETLFREFAEKINDVLWRVTPAMDRVIYVNPAFKKIWGISINKVYKNPQAWFNVIHPEDKEKVRKVFLTDIKHKSSVGVEFRIIRSDGSIRYIYSRGFSLKDNLGKMVSLLGISTDVTKYKRQQEYLILTREVKYLLENAAGIKTASSKILRLICNTCNWDFGEIWLMDFSANKLRNLNYWSNPKEADPGFNLKSRTITFKSGVDLPGKIFQDAKPVWIENILEHAELIRTDEAIHAEFNSALGIPVIFQGKILGVIDFFSNKIAKPDKILLKMIANIANLFAELTHRTYTEEQIIYESTHDKLTDFLNRDALEEQLNRIIATKKYPLVGVLLLGVDQQRHILTSIGYDTADYLILAIADRLRKSTIENEAKIARVIPDKFVFILKNIHSIEEIVNQANTILGAFHEPFFIKGKEFFINPCIGIALYPQDGDNSTVLLQHGANALNLTSQPYQNNIQFCTKELTTNVLQKLSMEGDLRNALLKNEFTLCYQPQIDLHTGYIIGLEALIRWRHPILGLLLPKDFIPLAEDSGLIIEIDRWVLKEIWMQIASGWPTVTISVNISAQHFKKHFLLLAYIKDLNTQYKIKPNQIEFEITESHYFNETSESLDILNYFNDEGIGITLDDFGKGYSSLQYLLYIPLQKIKIDKSFIDNITSDPKSISIVKALILLAHSLGKKVIAEGVETREQLQVLQTLQCDEVQGYYFYKPIPLKKIKVLLKKMERVSSWHQPSQ